MGWRRHRKRDGRSRWRGARPDSRALKSTLPSGVGATRIPEDDSSSPKHDSSSPKSTVGRGTGWGAMSCLRV